MQINTREIARHLARFSQLLESNAAFYAALNQFEDAAGQLSKEAKDIAELADFLYEAKMMVEIPSGDNFTICGYLNGLAPNAVFSTERRSEFSVPVYIRNSK